MIVRSREAIARPGAECRRVRVNRGDAARYGRMQIAIWRSAFVGSGRFRRPPWIF
jgi:hypothetical protein